MTTTQVAKQVNTGRSWMHDGTREVPATLSSCPGARLCPGGRVDGATADAWCWKTGSYKKLEKRPAGIGLFTVFGADEQHDYFYPRGILHREGAGRSWAITNTSNIPGVD